jgi:phosphatidylglycerophosphate synthase
MTGAPIREALIVRAPGDPLRPVARVPLLVRTILALQKAGVERCTLVGDVPAPRDPRIRCAVDAAPALVPAADQALRLIVGSDAVIDRALVLGLQARARPGEVLEVEAGGARVRVAPGPLVVPNGGRRAAPESGTLARADAPGLEQRLLGALENPRDGYLDRVLHRRLSRPLSRLLVRTPLSPNALTAIGVALGVAGGLLLALPGVLPVLAAVGLLVAAGALDCSDGEIARLCHAESRLGHVLDVTGDTLVHLAVLGGIALRLAESPAAPGRATLVVLGAGVLGAFAAISWSEAAEVRRRRVAGWENRLLDGVLSPLSTRDWHVFPLAFALAGRLDLLVQAAAVGAHLFWITVVLVLRRALARAAR